MKSLVDLEIDKYKMYQDKDLFCFGMDAVLLANFTIDEMNINGASAPRFFNGFNIGDLCSGNAPIPFIIYAKLKSKNISAHFTCFEINEKAVALANDSIDYNSSDDENDGPKDKNMKDNFIIHNIDIKKIIFDKEKYKDLRDHFDIITCNPPYMKKGACIKSESEEIAIARSEEKINFDEIANAANFMLKSGKKFYIIHKSERLAEIIDTLKKNNLEPKKIKFIHSSISKNSNLFLLEAVKDAKSGLSVLNPIIIDKNSPLSIQ